MLNLTSSLLILFKVPCIKNTVATMAGFYHCDCILNLGLRAQRMSAAPRLSVTNDLDSLDECRKNGTFLWWVVVGASIQVHCMSFL
jgi:hypothetical protein